MSEDSLIVLKSVQYIVAFDIGHTTGVTVARVQLEPFFIVTYLTSFEHRGLPPKANPDWLSFLNNVDEVWVEYPKINTFSKQGTKTAEIMQAWQLFLASVNHSIVLPGTWKNSNVSTLKLQSQVYLSGSSNRLGPHEKDAFGIIWWRAYKLKKVHADL